MQEWLNWPAWKASKRQKRFRGSNPLLSARTPDFTFVKSGVFFCLSEGIFSAIDGAGLSAGCRSRTTRTVRTTAPLRGHGRSDPAGGKKGGTAHARCRHPSTPGRPGSSYERPAHDVGFRFGALYQVETKALHRAVKRNIERLPKRYMFQLNQEEFAYLRCQIETSSRHGGTRYLPNAFTEQGVSMLSAALPITPTHTSWEARRTASGSTSRNRTWS